MKYLIAVFVLSVAAKVAQANLCNIRDFYQVCEKTTNKKELYYSCDRDRWRAGRDRHRDRAGGDRRFNDHLRPMPGRVPEDCESVLRAVTQTQHFKCPSYRPNGSCLELLRDHSIVCNPCCNAATPVIRHCNTYPGTIIAPEANRRKFSRVSGSAARGASVSQDVYVRPSFRNLVNIPNEGRLMS